MSRYYYYLILINMVANIIAAVPGILFYFHMKGTVSAMIIAVFAGTILITIYTRFFLEFPGMTLPELLQKTTTKWFYNPFIFFLAVMWFIAGMITLVAFTFMLIRYLTPDMPIMQIAFTIILFVILGCLMTTDRVLYTIEIIVLITFPLIVFIFMKAYGSDYIRWDFVKEAALYLNQMPNISAFSACFYLFLGSVNLFIFNRFFTKKQTFGWKQISVIIMVSTITLFTTFFIPIGYHGSEGIKNYVFPWIATSDSLRMQYGFIERVLFIFLLFYLAIAFLSILIHWHVSFEFLKFVFNLEKIKWKKINIGKFLPIPLFVGISLFFVVTLNENQLFRYASYFYNIVMPFFPIMVILLFFIRRRMKYVKKAEQN